MSFSILKELVYSRFWRMSGLLIDPFLSDNGVIIQLSQFTYLLELIMLTLKSRRAMVFRIKTIAFSLSPTSYSFSFSLC